MQWQEIGHNEISFIYIFVQQFRNCINNRFQNLHETSMIPGAWFAEFKVKKGYTIEADK